VDALPAAILVVTALVLPAVRPARFGLVLLAKTTYPLRRPPTTPNSPTSTATQTQGSPA